MKMTIPSRPGPRRVDPRRGNGGAKPKIGRTKKEQVSEKDEGCARITTNDLCEPRQERPGQHHAAQSLEQVLGAKIEADVSSEGVPPVVVACKRRKVDGPKSSGSVERSAFAPCEGYTPPGLS